MSRRSRHRRERHQSVSPARYWGGSYPPQSLPTRRALQTLPEPVLYLQTRALALDPPVFASRTVRPPLMRTVPRDTTLRNFNNRRSPDLPGRALARMKPWTTFETPPLPRAVTCARRQIRKEVLFALGRGNGAGSKGIPKSKERCT